MRREGVDRIGRNERLAVHPGAKVPAAAAPSPTFVVAAVVMASSSDVP